MGLMVGWVVGQIVGCVVGHVLKLVDVRRVLWLERVERVKMEMNVGVHVVSCVAWSIVRLVATHLKTGEGKTC